MENYPSYNQKIWDSVSCEFWDSKIDNVAHDELFNISIYDSIKDKLFKSNMLIIILSE